VSGAGRETRILYETPRLCVFANNLRSPIRFVTFNQLFYRPERLRFWGDSFFAKHSFGAIGFVSSGPDWFPAAEVEKAIAAIRPALAPQSGERLVAYGASMGAYAALKYGSRLGVDTAIAFSPQMSIDPADVAWFDPRFLHFFDAADHSGMRIRAEDLPRESHIVYDGFLPSDRRHAETIAALGPVQLFSIPLTAHFTIQALAQGRIARPFLDRLLGPEAGRAAELRGMVRRTRRDTLVYWEGRATTLTRRHPSRTRTILHAVEKAHLFAPDAVIWKLALVTALLNCGEPEEAERELEKIDPGKQTPIEEWLRYIECYRRLHGDQATLAMMANASDEVRRHPAFRFEEAVIRFDIGEVASTTAILDMIWPEQEQITRRLMLGSILGRVGEREKALSVFRAHAELVPSAGNLVPLATALAEDAANKDGANPESRAEALSHLAASRAVLDPPDHALWRRVLSLYERLDAPAEQLAAAREALAALPLYPDLRMELAIALERAGKPAEARALAARLAPRHAAIRRLDWLILLLRRAGMDAEALDIARFAASERPEDLAARLQLAVLLLARDEEEEAFEHLLAVRLRPGAIRPDLAADAIAAFAAVGLNNDAAIAAARRAAAHPDALAVQLNLSGHLVRAGRANEARAHLAAIRPRLGTDPAALIAIAEAFHLAGEDNRAEDLLARALGAEEPGEEIGEAREPATAHMRLIALRARHTGWLGRRAARRAAARLAAASRPDPAFWAGLAELFAALGQSSRAASAIARAVSLAPAAPDPAYALREAELFLAAGKRAAARRSLAALLARSPSPAAFARAVPLLEQAGDLPSARAAALAWRAAAPHDRAARLALAGLLIRAGEVAAGRAHLAPLMEGRAGDAAYWTAVAALELDLRDWPEARRAAERAIANDPSNAARAREILGMAALVGARAPAAQPSPRQPAHPAAHPAAAGQSTA
jgi:thioredoxin-like negative regulator of GroEL